MKGIDFTKIFDSMKTNDISELIIKEGGRLYEIRRGGFKQNVISGPQTPQTIVHSVQQAGQSIAVAQGATNVVSQPSGEVLPVKESNLHEIKSPLVGTYYSSPKPDTPPFVEIGSKVTKGQTLCIVEAMKNFNEIDCEVDGIVKEICVKNGELVEYGKVLFRIELQ